MRLSSRVSGQMSLSSRISGQMRLSSRVNGQMCLSATKNKVNKPHGLHFVYFRSWTGGRCADRVIVDPCAKRPCLNGGVCFSDKAGKSYVCRCGVNFGGRNCEKRVIVDPCSRNPCLNGGVCFSDKARKYYFCRCQGNFKGKVTILHQSKTPDGRFSSCIEKSSE